MAANVEHVKKLIAAAWVGMSTVMQNEPDGTFSAEDIINAAINVGHGAVKFTCKSGADPEQVAHNRRAVRDALAQMMLDTADTETVQ